MAPTLKDGGVWYWYHVWHDLQTTGGLGRGIVIDPTTTFEGQSGGGKFNGHKFTFTRWPGEAFRLNMWGGFHQALVDAFTKVLEDSPFCRYLDQDSGGGQVVTVEWNVVDPGKRFQELQARGQKEIVRL